MDNKSNKSHTDEHNQQPSDEVTRNKIDKHLKDINDTISEEDIKNINTDLIPSGGETTTIDKEQIDKISEINNDDNKDDDGKDDDEPQKETPSPWEILR